MREPIKTDLKLTWLPTPLERHDALSERHNVDFYFKRDDLTDPFGGGAKLRRLEYIIDAALKQGCTDIISIGRTGSNQFRLLSSIGNKLGLQVHLLAFSGSENEPEGERSNLFLSNLLGAKVRFLTEKEWKLYPLAVKKMTRKLEKEDRKPVFISLGATESIGALGTLNLARELAGQLTGTLNKSYIVTPAGTGATLFGLDAAFQLPEYSSESPAGLLGMTVHEHENDLRGKIEAYYQEFNRDFETELILTEKVEIYDVRCDGSYDIASARDIENITALAEQYGLVFDYQYQLRPFMKLMDLLDKKRFPDGSQVVFLVTGGMFSIFDLQNKIQADN